MFGSVFGTCLPHQVLLCSAAWPSACWKHFPLVHWDEWKKLKYLLFHFIAVSPLFHYTFFAMLLVSGLGDESKGKDRHCASCSMQL